MEIWGWEAEQEKHIDITVKEESKFKKFLSLKSLFKKEDNPKEALQNRAKHFINTNNYEAYVKMLSQGYQPTQNQVNAFQQIVNELLTCRLANGSSIIRLEKLLEDGLKLNEGNVLYFIKDSKFNSLFYKNNDFFKSFNTLSSDNHLLINLTQQVQEVIHRPHFPNMLLDTFSTYINHKKSVYKDVIETFRFILEYNPALMLKNLSFDNFVKLNEKLQSQELYSNHYIILTNITNNFYSNDLNTILDTTKSNYSNNLVKNLTIEKIKSENHKINDLPEDVLDIIKNIENLYNKIQESKNTHTDIEQLNIMLEKRIPEILSKYLTIDPSYRTSLKNTDGKNAQELMTEGLTNIYTTFENVYKDINQESIHSLSATTRYTKSFK